MNKSVHWTLVATTAGLLMASGCAEADPAATTDSVTTIDPLNPGEDAGDVTPFPGGDAGPGPEGGTPPPSGGAIDAGPPDTDSGANADAGPPSGAALVRISEKCVENRTFAGQMYPKPTEPNSGGMVVMTPLDASYDAGLMALYAASPADGELATGLQLQVTSATVTATGYGTSSAKRLWLEDGKSAIHLRMETPVTIGGQEAVVKVGSKLSFVVTSLRNYHGVLQVESAEGWTFTGTDQPVYLRDRTGGDLTSADLHRLIRVTGVLSGAPEVCGGTSKCWKLDYKGKTEVLFRSASKFIDTGACVTFVGPANLFNGTPQLDTANFSWLWNND